MKGLFSALKSKRGGRHGSETGGSPAESAPVRHAPIPAVAAATVLPAVPGAVHRHLGTPQNGPNSFRLPVEPAATAGGDSPTSLSRPQLLTESNVARSANGYQRQAQSSGGYQQAVNGDQYGYDQPPYRSIAAETRPFRSNSAQPERQDDRHWDVQSVAPSLSPSLAPSFQSAMTAPVASSGGRMKMILPSPSRPPARANSVAGDRRISDSGGRYTPQRPPASRGAPRSSGAGGRPSAASRGITPKKLILPGATDEAAEEEFPISETDTVKVFVRARPINEREVQLGGGADRVCLELTGPQSLRLHTTPQPHSYTFDCVAGGELTQEALYQMAGKPIVDNCLNGFNSCIFAYGQTGAGKTYTMMGAGYEPGLRPDKEQAKLRGLIPRVFDDVFSRLKAMQEVQEAGVTTDVTIKCSFLEIYNEVITDLLNPEATHLLIREDAKKGIYVERLSQHIVHKMEDVAGLLERGQETRKSGETLMNSESSRSHSVFTAELCVRSLDDSGITSVLSSRLNLVDLAGSERQRQSGATGDRLKEASGINVSLTVLGKVIMSLVDFQRGKVQHVPYRNSRLTFLLRDSLGGNAKTIMIANVSPAVANMADTLSTLRFAQRVKAIQNTVFRNEDTQGDAAQLRLEIKRLKGELYAYQKAAAGWQPNAAGGGRAMSPLSTPGTQPWASPASQPPAGSPWQDHGTTMQSLTGALRREGELAKEVKRLGTELDALQSLLKARDADLQRLKQLIRHKDVLLAKLEKSVNDSEEFSFASGEKEAIILTLREELRVVRARMEHNPEVQRRTAENAALAAELARVKSFVEAGERDALLLEVDAMRVQLLHLDDTIKRLSAAPQVRQAQAQALITAHEASVQLEESMAQAAEKVNEVSEVADLRVRLLEEQMAAEEIARQLAAAESDRDREAAEKTALLTQLTAFEHRSAKANAKPHGSPEAAQPAELSSQLNQLQTENASHQAQLSGGGAPISPTFSFDRINSNGHIPAVSPLSTQEPRDLAAAPQPDLASQLEAQQAAERAKHAQQVEELRVQLQHERASASSAQEQARAMSTETASLRKDIDNLHRELHEANAAATRAAAEEKRLRAQSAAALQAAMAERERRQSDDVVHLNSQTPIRPGSSLMLSPAGTASSAAAAIRPFSTAVLQAASTSPQDVQIPVAHTLCTPPSPSAPAMQNGTAEAIGNGVPADLNRDGKIGANGTSKVSNDDSGTALTADDPIPSASKFEEAETTSLAPVSPSLSPDRRLTKERLNGLAQMQHGSTSPRIAVLTAAVDRSASDSPDSQRATGAPSALAWLMSGASRNPASPSRA